MHAVLCYYSCPLSMWGGGGANLNTVKRIVTLHWNQTNLIYIYITIHLKQVSIQMNLKIPCTSCSD